MVDPRAVFIVEPGNDTPSLSEDGPIIAKTAPLARLIPRTTGSNPNSDDDSGKDCSVIVGLTDGEAYNNIVASGLHRRPLRVFAR